MRRFINHQKCAAFLGSMLNLKPQHWAPLGSARYRDLLLQAHTLFKALVFFAYISKKESWKFKIGINSSTKFGGYCGKFQKSLFFRTVPFCLKGKNNTLQQVISTFATNQKKWILLFIKILSLGICHAKVHIVVSNSQSLMSSRNNVQASQENSDVTVSQPPISALKGFSEISTHHIIRSEGSKRIKYCTSDAGFTISF